MALTALNLNDEREYVSRSDPDKGKTDGNPTVFVVRTLDSFIMGKINDKLLGFDSSDVDPNNPDAVVDMSTSVNQSVAAFEACRFGIADIRNLVDPQTGDPVKFDTQELSLSGGRRYRVVKTGILERIPSTVLRELFEEIQKVNRVGEDEEKNLSGSSSPSNSSQRGTAKRAASAKSDSGAATPAG